MAWLDLLISKKAALIFVAVALFVFTMFLPIALGDSSSPNNGTVWLRIETDKSSYLQGEVVKVYVYVINGKSVPAEYPTMVGYYVSDLNGRAVGVGCMIDIRWALPIPTFPRCSETLFPVPMAPSDSSFWWGTINRDGKKVGVGTYSIKVQLEGREVSLSSEIAIRIYPNLDAYPRPSKWGFY